MLVSISNTLVCRFAYSAHDMIPNSASMSQDAARMLPEVEQITSGTIQLPVIGKLDRTNIRGYTNRHIGPFQCPTTLL
jgi:hypothetical protein